MPVMLLLDKGEEGSTVEVVRARTVMVMHHGRGLHGNGRLADDTGKVTGSCRRRFEPITGPCK